jgi:MiaB/RimO family radical SAM methylthiotransferase
MCSFCIVPHTRGREKARPVASIEDEVARLRDEGYKEITLLGQTVNSYHDPTTPSLRGTATIKYESAPGFNNMYKKRDGEGTRFTELLERLTTLAPGVRFRFTSPHPKDFPSDLIQLIKERNNLCKQVHLPAQSGSTGLLQAMRRQYTREAYLSLAQRMRETIPGLALSTDMISGFCGETEDDHLESLSLMREVKFEGAFLFAYSLRERTHAAYHLKDDVPEEVKKRRLNEVIAAYHKGALERNTEEVGRLHVVLVEGPARRSSPTAPQLSGKSDNFKTVILTGKSVENGVATTGADDADSSVRLSGGEVQTLFSGDAGLPAAAPRRTRKLAAGDFVVARITSAGPTSLKAEPVLHLSGGILDPAMALLPPAPVLR